MQELDEFNSNTSMVSSHPPLHLKIACYQKVLTGINDIHCCLGAHTCCKARGANYSPYKKKGEHFNNTISFVFHIQFVHWNTLKWRSVFASGLLGEEWEGPSLWMRVRGLSWYPGRSIEHTTQKRFTQHRHVHTIHTNTPKLPLSLLHTHTHKHSLTLSWTRTHARTYKSTPVSAFPLCEHKQKSLVLSQTLSMW